MLKHFGDKKFAMVVSEDTPAVYNYWPVACLLLYPGNALHHIKKTHSIKRNWTLCPLREMEMEKIANLTTLWINKMKWDVSDLINFKRVLLDFEIFRPQRIQNNDWSSTLPLC